MSGFLLQLSTCDEKAKLYRYVIYRKQESRYEDIPFLTVACPYIHIYEEYGHMGLCIVRKHVQIYVIVEICM